MDNTNENMTEDKDINKNNNGNSDDYEKICFVCRRPESRAGKMIVMPNNIYICQDCMQRTFDSINSSGINYEDMMKMSNMPGMGMFGNFGAMDSDPVPEKQKLKKKKENKKELPALDVSKLPAPHEIKRKLDEYVIGQDYAKKVMSVAVYNHYKRVSADAKILGDVEIEKSNMLMIGPTGSGKTYLVKTLAMILQVPLAITDATTLTEAGYIGDDIESVVSKLLLAADNDVEKAEHGIIFIDEIDKIAKKKETRSRDVSGESVQQGMLKLLEGSEIEVPVGATSKNAMVPQVTVNTKDILFICGGAFPDLEDIIKTRLNKSSSMGFNADLKDKYDDEKNIMSYVTVDDLREYGMIPEFLGRLPIIYSLDRLDEDMLVNILKEPKNAILKQYQKLLELDEVKLEFTDDALRSIARKAMEKDTGARALRSIIEDFMLAANETVAEDYFWQDMPFLYRTHENPDPEKMRKLATFINNFGYTLRLTDDLRPKEIQKLLSEIEGSDAENLISRLTLRSMKKAKYTTECVGHFGLAAKYYCHFTSPIRRYPDLQIHRIIKENLHGGLSPKRADHYDAILPDVAVQTSAMERRAADAERDTDKLKMAEYMEQFVGETFDGVVSGVTAWGVYVELPNTIEGMVSINNMKGFYTFDEEHYEMVGELGNRSYKLGQKVKVVVIGTDKILRTIDFAFA